MALHTRLLLPPLLTPHLFLPQYQPLPPTPPPSLNRKLPYSSSSSSSYRSSHIRTEVHPTQEEALFPPRPRMSLLPIRSSSSNTPTPPPTPPPRVRPLLLLRILLPLVWRLLLPLLLRDQRQCPWGRFPGVVRPEPMANMLALVEEEEEQAQQHQHHHQHQHQRQHQPAAITAVHMATRTLLLLLQPRLLKSAVSPVPPLLTPPTPGATTRTTAPIPLPATLALLLQARILQARTPPTPPPPTPLPKEPPLPQPRTCPPHPILPALHLLLPLPSRWKPPKWWRPSMSEYG